MSGPVLGPHKAAHLCIGDDSRRILCLVSKVDRRLDCLEGLGLRPYQYDWLCSLHVITATIITAVLTS